MNRKSLRFTRVLLDSSAPLGVIFAFSSCFIVFMGIFRPIWAILLVFYSVYGSILHILVTFLVFYSVYEPIWAYLGNFTRVL